MTLVKSRIGPVPRGGQSQSSNKWKAALNVTRRAQRETPHTCKKKGRDGRVIGEPRPMRSSIVTACIYFSPAEFTSKGTQTSMCVRAHMRTPLPAKDFILVLELCNLI